MSLLTTEKTLTLDLNLGCGIWNSEFKALLSTNYHAKGGHSTNLHEFIRNLELENLETMCRYFPDGSGIIPSRRGGIEFRLFSFFIFYLSVPAFCSLLSFVICLLSSFFFLQSYFFS